MAVVQFNLRVPEELKKQVDEASQISGRSINAEAIYRLEQSFAKEELQKPATMNVIFDDDWFGETGLSKEEFGAFVRMAVQSNVAKYKVDGKDD